MRLGRCNWQPGHLAASGRVLRRSPIGVLLLAALLAGCGSSQVTTPPSPTPCVVGTPAPSPQPLASEPTPVAARGWSTYINTTYHYRLPYPSNWFLPGASATSGNVYLFNFDPSQFDQADRPPPPYNEIEVDALANPSQQSLADFYAANKNSPAGPPPCAVTTQPSTIAGHQALQVVEMPTANAGPGALTYPAVSVFVADGTTILALYEFYSPGGQPSSVFAHMLSGLTFTA
jgi:hypothetical protein